MEQSRAGKVPGVPSLPPEPGRGSRKEIQSLLTGLPGTAGPG